jgi:hypothetical protein
MLLEFPTDSAPNAEPATPLPARTDPNAEPAMNRTAAALTLIAVSVPTLSVAAKEAPRSAGIRGQLETLAKRSGPSESQPLRIRFSAPSWEEMRFARGLGSLLQKGRARAERVTYRGEQDAQGKVLRGRGVRVDLGGRAHVERIRFRNASEARRFAVLHVPLGEGACFVEVRGPQVGVLRGSSVASTRNLREARRGLWNGLPAPSVDRPTLLLSRPSRDVLVLHGSLDRKTRGVLRELVDRSESDVRAYGAEEARAPGGEMRQGASGRIAAWIDGRADRRERTAALSETLSRIPRSASPARRGATGSLAGVAPSAERFGYQKPGTRPERVAPKHQPGDQRPSPAASAEVVTLRAKIDVALRSQPGGAWNSDLRAGELCIVVGRAGAWLEVTDQSGRALGWVLFDKDLVELKTFSPR